jgi:hypothetical protein
MTAPQWRKSRRSDTSGNACVELARLEPTGPGWRKSRRSDTSGNACVELARLEPTGPGWWKSRRSDVSGNDCVEIAELPAAIGVRDSKNPGSGHLILDRWAAKALFSDIKAGRHDL